MGPTASGKSDLAFRLARERDLEIISVDSMQVYRGMDIGTAKPTADEQAMIPHHMIDVADPADDYTVAEFQVTGRPIVDDLGERALIVGGSGLHLRSLIDPLEFPRNDPSLRSEIDALDDAVAVEELTRLDPAAGEHIDLQNPRRVQRALEVARLGDGTPSERANSPTAQAVRAYLPRRPVRIIGIDPGDQVRSRAASRFESMLASGLLDEVRRLAPHLGRNARQAVGYKELLGVVDGSKTTDEGAAEAVAATVALARRQRTFFGRDPRIRWIQWSDELDDRYAALQRTLGEPT